MFADQLTNRIQNTKSFLCAGLDPRLLDLPLSFRAELDGGSETGIEKTLLAFYSPALEAIASQIACIKPNIAFFEALGIGGLRALQKICLLAKQLSVPVVLDAKRGDIGSTAQAYADAYFNGITLPGNGTKATVPFLHTDALTVNPFLGLDTLEPFVTACSEQGKGIFVLVKTSNPGSGDLQDQKLASGHTVSEFFAQEVANLSERVVGKSGYSSIGAVVGATYPEQAEKLRHAMPNSYFLIPGLGSQGGSAKEAVAGFDTNGGGGIVNASRGIFSSFTSPNVSVQGALDHIVNKVKSFNGELASALRI